MPETIYTRVSAACRNCRSGIFVILATRNRIGPEANADFAYQPGTGRIHDCAVRQ